MTEKERERLMALARGLRPVLNEPRTSAEEAVRNVLWVVWREAWNAAVDKAAMTPGDEKLVNEIRARYGDGEVAIVSDGTAIRLIEIVDGLRRDLGAMTQTAETLRAAVIGLAPPKQAG